MAGPRLAVVDASVVMKWFLPERFSDEARALLRAHAELRLTLAAPAILPYEVANGLRFHPELGEDAVAGAIGHLFGAQLRLDPLSPEAVSSAVRVAYRTGLAVYDACYLSLAERLTCPLYTADQHQLAADPARARALSGFRE